VARKDALLRLYEQLRAQRDALRKTVQSGMGLSGESCGAGDAAAVAYDDAERELNTQLAALESRELHRIERALASIREGRYGQCEGCGRPIPIARLQALPYTSCCVNCQRTQESSGRGRGGDADWSSACDFQAREHDQELSVREVDME
jgi:DnaK suppressor protein